MKDKILKFYKNLYSNFKRSKYVFGTPEKELVRFANTVNWKKVKVLDLGCGDGRNIIFLASKNYEVLGIDNSTPGLKKIKNYIKNTGISKNIRLRQANLKTVKLKQNNFDLVVCVYTFHEIGAAGTKNTIKQAKLSTKPLGINYLAFFIPKEGTHIRKECYYPDESTIIKQYKGWKILKKKKVLMSHSHMTPSSKGKQITHKHYVCHLFLQKPK